MDILWEIRVYTDFIIRIMLLFLVCVDIFEGFSCSYDFVLERISFWSVVNFCIKGWIKVGVNGRYLWNFFIIAFVIVFEIKLVSLF